MTGQLIYQGKNTDNNDKSFLPSKHTHLIFYLDDGILYYNDMRKFGWVKIIKTPQVFTLPFFKYLGKEPLRDLTLAEFEKIVKSKKLPIKVLLMDQRLISGIGNIYANDALFSSKIN